MKTYGHFSSDGREYIITDKNIPRKWENFVWNSSFLCRVDQDGGGESLFKHVGGMRTKLNKGNRMVFLRDNSMEEFWNVPGNGENETAVHGLGYTKYSSFQNDLEVLFSVTVPRDIKGEAWTIKVKNSSGKVRKISIFTYMELGLEGYFTPFGSPKLALRVLHDEKLNSLLYINNDAYCPTENFNAYITADIQFKAFQTVRERFAGSGSLQKPEEVAKGFCDSTLYQGGDELVGVLQFDIELSAGQEKEIQVISAIFEEMKEVEAVVSKYSKPGAVKKELEGVTEEMQSFLGNVQIDTPDNHINRLFNIWAKYNLKLTSQWTRIYSRGFRDTLQDTMGIVSLDSVQAKENILTAMRYVYNSGRCKRAWDNVAGALGDEFYADGPIWIPLTINAYIKETGDALILEEVCPYFDGGTGTVLEHMLRAVRFLYKDRGEYGLSLIHDGDWCDTAHLLGKKGKGEGVWLSIALYNAIKEVIELAEFTGNTELRSEFEDMALEVRENVNEYGWDGDWFLIAYNDEGRKIGSNENKEGKIFLNPQSWAVISGITTPEREDKCLKNIDDLLDSSVGPLLLTPPFTMEDRGIGTLTGFSPGTIENGSCYCHAASFKIVADCIKRRGNKAFDTLKKIIPGGESDTNNPIADCPPYAFTNSRIAPFHPYMAGRHLHTWITGTISWSWQAVTEWMLGARRTFKGLMIDPCIPSEWTFYKITRYFRDSIYEIEVHNPEKVEYGVKELYLDGNLIEGNTLPLTSGKKHEVKVIMGR